METKEFITWARETGRLVEIEHTVDPHLELARVTYALDGQPVLFRTLAGFPGWQAVSGVCAQREHFAAALDCALPDLVHRMADALAHPTPPPVINSGPCQEVVEGRVNLTHLPIPRYHPDDGGRYITAGVKVIEDANFGVPSVPTMRLYMYDETVATTGFWQYDWDSSNWSEESPIYCKGV